MKTISLKKQLILSIIFFLISVLIFFFLLKDVNEKRELLTKTQEEWKIESTYRENISSLISSMGKIEDEVILLEKHFVQSSDVVPFLDTIEELAKKVGIKADVLSVDIPKDNSSLIMEAKALGNFESIYKFTLLLENSPYEMEFLSVDIQNPSVQDLSTVGSKNSQWVANYRIKLLSFVN